MRQHWTWMCLWIAAETIVIALIAAVIMNLYMDLGFAEDAEIYYEEGYVLCMPEDYVNIRLGASRTSSEVGWKSPGDVVYLDGKERNGYLHCVDPVFGYGEGWIHSGYVIYDEPEYINRTATIVSNGRLAARKHVGGKRTRWLKPQATVRVIYWGNEWCLTNCGYVQSRYLELDGE